MSTSRAEDEERLVTWLWPRDWCTDDAIAADDAVDETHTSASRFGVEPCIRVDRAGYIFKLVNTIIIVIPVFQQNG